MLFTILIEQSPNNYGAWSPDLPGCVVTGATVEETISNMRGAIALHLKGMKEDGEPIPEPALTIMTTLQVAT